MKLSYFGINISKITAYNIYKGTDLTFRAHFITGLKIIIFNFKKQNILWRIISILFLYPAIYSGSQIQFLYMYYIFILLPTDGLENYPLQNPLRPRGHLFKLMSFYL